MKQLLIILFLTCGTLNAATYYVKTGGNDANTGLSDAQAWAHHPWMSTWTEAAKVLSPGDIVLMNRGDTWTHATSGNYMTVAQNGSAGSYIKTGAYGTGALPHIHHSYSSGSLYSVIYADAKSYLIFDSLNIEHASSTYGEGMGIYLYGATNPCHDIIITNCEIENIPHHAIYGSINCYDIAIGDTTATATATTSAYSNHIHDFGYAGIGLMGCKLSTLISNNKVYYNYIHGSTRTTAGDNAYGIYFSTTTGSYGDSKYCYANFNYVKDILTWEGIDCHSGNYLYFQDNYISNCGFQGIALSTATRGSMLLHHVYCDRNTIEYTSGWVTGREAAFIYFYNTVTENSSTEIYIRDNILRYASRPTSGLFAGIRINGTNGMTVSGNQIYNGSTAAGSAAISVTGSGGGTNANIVIENNFIKQWGMGISAYGSAVTGSVIIRENIISKPPNSACIRFYDAISSTGALTLYNNVFLNDAYAYVFYHPFTLPVGASITAKNNILARATSGTLTYWYISTSSGTFTCDYNMYWNSSTASPFYINGGARTFAVWQSTYGKDAHGLNATNPLWTNAGGSYLLDMDFEIPTGSPAKNTGIGVGITTDYFGNAIDATPDIGVFEFAGTPPADELPTVTTATTTYIPYTSASSGGNVTDEGTASVTARGVCWSTSVNPTTADSRTTDGTGAGVYASSITSLDADLVYYVRAYATSTVGTAYGAQVSFQTLDPAVVPTITTQPVFNVYMTSASSGGTITDDGNADITAKGVCWGASINPTTAGSKTIDGTGISNFTSSMTGLTADTPYYVRAYATNSAGTAYGSNVLFTTAAAETRRVYMSGDKVIYIGTMPAIKIE